mgnify:CR=1 FL=1
MIRVIAQVIQLLVRRRSDSRRDGRARLVERRAGYEVEVGERGAEEGAFVALVAQGNVCGEGEGLGGTVPFFRGGREG